ncbi:homoserine dehydrogenase [Mycoplasmatota bacterium]|nr:homoserine dehydrogenase [Mycoplasmatota bacterium]
MKKIGLLGIGTVGSGVYEIINNRKNELNQLLGEEIEISKILVNDINKKRNLSLPKDILTDNFSDILNNPQIDIVVEAMGGIDTAYEFISSALKKDKHVVTANKAVISRYIDELSALAKEKYKGLLFEASVGGGIPVIKPLTQSIATNEITEIKGILNGTTNFILTKMSDENLSFDEALNLAYKLGYAEADPTDDIEGFDVRRKIAILSSIAYKIKIDEDDILCRGIRSISPLDIMFFKKKYFTVKLIGCSINKNNEFSASVEPILVQNHSFFSTVKNSFNIVSIIGSTVGELQFYGQGAGKNPTANAVVSDIIDIINDDYKSLEFKDLETIKPVGAKLLKGRYYIRITPEDKKQITEIIKLLDRHNLKYNIFDKEENLILVTKTISAEYMNKVIDTLNINYPNYCCLRIEDELTDEIETNDVAVVAM